MTKYMIDVGDIIIETTKQSGKSDVLLVLDVNLGSNFANSLIVRHFVFNSTENRIAQLFHHVPDCKNDENCACLVDNKAFKLIKRPL